MSVLLVLRFVLSVALYTLHLPTRLCATSARKFTPWGLAISRGTLASTDIIAQDLFQSIDGKKGFKREMLSFGIQGVQELNRAKQEADLT